LRDNVNKLGRAIFAGPQANLPAVLTAGSYTGQTIDLAQYNAATLYILAGTWTDGIHTYVINEAPDVAGSPGSFTAVAATDLSRLETANSAGGFPITQSSAGSQPAAITSAATALNQRVGYLGGQRFLQVVLTTSGTTTGAKHAAFWVLGEPRVLPAAV
jgi:hypothetical protein